MISGSQKGSYIGAGAASIALLWLLLAVPYSFGVGTTSYGIGAYLWTNWTTNPDMEHGFIVLPAIVYLIYEKRKDLAEISIAGPSLIGFVVLALGLFLFWAGSQADVTSIGLLSLMIVAVGLVWFLLGWRALLLLSFPIGFFVFAIPLPGLDSIASDLRLIMSKNAVFVLNLIGVDVIRQGTGILSAPDPLLGLAAGRKFTVDIADPCSGIRSLFALLMVSALYAHFTLKIWWEKWILFLCAIPLAIVGNLVRILALTIATVVFGAEFAIGKNALTAPSWFHEGAGFLVFAVALGGMIGIGSLLCNLESIITKIQGLIRSVKHAGMAVPPDSGYSTEASSSSAVEKQASELKARPTTSSRPSPPEAPY